MVEWGGGADREPPELLYPIILLPSRTPCPLASCCACRLRQPTKPGRPPCLAMNPGPTNGHPPGGALPSPEPSRPPDTQPRATEAAADSPLDDASLSVFTNWSPNGSTGHGTVNGQGGCLWGPLRNVPPGGAGSQGCSGAMVLPPGCGHKTGPSERPWETRSLSGARPRTGPGGPGTGREAGRQP